MRKRHINDTNELEPSRKKQHNGIQSGEIMYDITGKAWKLGNPIGQGAFGQIFSASDCITKEVSDCCPYVAKIELHTNGPLFVETHFYLRAAKQEQINEWKLKTKKTIGLPHYIAFGSHVKQSTKYRFLILPRYTIDIQKILDQHNNKFNIKTVLTIALELLDILEYIHSKGFIHADIKASNIAINEKQSISSGQYKEKRNNNALNGYRSNYTRLRTCKTRSATRNLRPNKYLTALPSADPTTVSRIVNPQEDCNNNIDTNQVYLLDFGLASKYLHSNGNHKPYCIDVRKAHAGTILFCSLDAHNGVQSRRSDLESLGYNMVHWLTGTLPWTSNVDDYEIVKKKKQMCMQELNNFLHTAFGKNIPTFLKSYFTHVNNLEFEQLPNYELLRKVLVQGFTEYGYTKVFTLDFENNEGWGIKKKPAFNRENDKKRTSVVCTIIRTPLKSNLPKVVLRKKNKAKERMLRWSNILIDPEVIIKSAKKVRDKVNDETDSTDALLRLNLDDLNPTDAMIHVYNNYFERHHNIDFGLQQPKNKGDGSHVIQGYNATMMMIYNKLLQRENDLENELTKISKRRGRPKQAAKTRNKKSEENIKVFPDVEVLKANNNILSERKHENNLNIPRKRGRPKGTTKSLTKFPKVHKKKSVESLPSTDVISTQSENKTEGLIILRKRKRGMSKILQSGRN